MDRVETIVGTMAAAAGSPETQLAQTRFRIGLVESWAVPEGASVLEIGCGQGDMTAVLADAVGETGRVVALDIAEPSYGAPVTLGESAAFLMATPLGSRIDMRFGVDVLDETTTFPEDSFDYVVLSHCSWYFASLDQLQHTFARIRPWARQLCFSEWDLRPRSLGQLPHLLAVLVQGQIEATGVRGEGNVRTPFSRENLVRTLEAAQWRVSSERAVDAAMLQDADWEVAACLDLAGSDPRFTDLPPVAKDFVRSQVDVLRSVARERGNEPLPSYSIIAARS